MSNSVGKFDVVVIGAGHAGCEAALACARLGCHTAVFTLSTDSIANMPCNPRIGGTSKGHLVREIDALGGEMGKIADKAFVQSRMLNKSKGPAVHSLRVQMDKSLYQELMKRALEEQPGLEIKQGEIAEIMQEDGNVTGVKTSTGEIYNCKCVIMTTGTYLKARIIIGTESSSEGPDGLPAANELTANLEKLGLRILRFKTGTPARLNKNGIDYSKMQEQKGDEKIYPFSFENEEGIFPELPSMSCWLTYTTPETHKIIRDNLHRSPMYSGDIDGVGARYCPSIEDKIVRFPDRPAHQIFVEPMGRNTDEIYLQGMSSSMPEEVQTQMIRSLPGLDQVEILKTGYAIEYDCIDATQLHLSLESKGIEGLFSAGQINGSSGYEEAAAQGLVAGINAVNKIKGKESLVIKRSEGYIGVLIDDLVTKGTKEPYRMMTSRAEYRLLLRQDNADMRLTKMGYEAGLISEERYKKFCAKKELIENEIKRLTNKIVPPNQKVLEFLAKHNSTAIVTGIRLADLLKRPEIVYNNLKEIDDEMPSINEFVEEQIDIEIKYEGYIKRQFIEAEKVLKLENKKLPKEIDYIGIKGLRLEARQKLDDLRPESIGQASRISGVSPADISVLLIFMEQYGRQFKK
jgi:tRNA uridine 5-carboxymethylaminomethyl modification enzyme